MRKFVFAAAALAGLFGATQVMAAAVPGYEGLYSANYAACILPDGTLVACETAIQAHVTALVSGDVELETANASFQELRSEVYAANAADEDFQRAIDDLFELLLPDSGAIGPLDTDSDADAGTPTTLVDGSATDAPVPGSPS